MKIVNGTPQTFPIAYKQGHIDDSVTDAIYAMISMSFLGSEAMLNLSQSELGELFTCGVQTRGVLFNLLIFIFLIQTHYSVKSKLALIKDS